MTKDEMKTFILEEYLDNPAAQAQDVLARLNHDMVQQQQTYQGNFAAAAASGGRYEGSPPPELVSSFAAATNSADPGPQKRDDLINAFQEVLSSPNLNGKNIPRLFSLYMAAGFSDEEMIKAVGIAIPLRPQTERSVARPIGLQGAAAIQPNPPAPPIQQDNVGYSSEGFARVVAKMFNEYADPRREIDDASRNANIAIATQMTAVIARVSNPEYKPYVDILANLLNSGNVEAARLMLKMVKDHAPQHLDVIHKSFTQRNETSSPLQKSAQNVVLIADLIKNFGDPASREADFRNMLTNSGFCAHTETPKKLLLQSNPTSLPYFIEISGGLQAPENQNLLGSIANFLRQPENAKTRQEEACQNSLIWLVERFPETRGDFEEFLNQDRLLEVKSGHVQKLTKIFGEVITPEFQELGYDPQIEAGKFFNFLHSKEFQEQWANLSNRLQISHSLVDPASPPKMRHHDDSGATLSLFETLTPEIMKLILAGALKYQIDCSLFKEEVASKLSEVILKKAAERVGILPDGLVVPAKRRPAATATVVAAVPAAAAAASQVPGPQGIS